MDLNPTQIERLSTTIRQTARRLWRLYVGLTVAAIVLLSLLGLTGLDDEMTIFDAFGQAFSVVSLGGFATRNDSIAGFGR